MIATLLIVNAALLAVLIFFVIFLKSKTSQARKQQNQILERMAGELKAKNWRRVVVSSPAYFRKRLKLLPYESRGVLISDSDQVTLIIPAQTGTPTIQRHARADISVEWLGSSSLNSGNLYWLKLGWEGEERMISADTGIYALPSREETSDLMRLLKPECALPKSALEEFALEKNRASLTVMVLFFAMTALAIVDGVFLNQHMLLNKPVLYWMVFPPMLLGVPCYWLLQKYQVPFRESHTLSILFALALAGFSVATMKRLDQWLAEPPAAPYAYKFTGNSRFEPVETGLPPLRFSGVREYWAQFETGSIHHFPVFKGAFGLWQLDETELQAKYREFYEKQP